jgi:hypothetical protein
MSKDNGKDQDNNKPTPSWASGQCIIEARDFDYCTGKSSEPQIRKYQQDNEYLVELMQQFIESMKNELSPKDKTTTDIICTALAFKDTSHTGEYQNLLTPEEIQKLIEDANLAGENPESSSEDSAN